MTASGRCDGPAREGPHQQPSPRASALVPPLHEIVVAALVREGRVLLVHRTANRRAFPGVWDLPGGHVEVGETELSALTREVHEELGVQIAEGSATQVCRLDIGPRGEPARLSAWLVRAWQGTPTNVAPEEHDEIRWFRSGELPAFAHEGLGEALLDAMRSAGLSPPRMTSAR